MFLLCVRTGGSEGVVSKGLSQGLVILQIDIVIQRTEGSDIAVWINLLNSFFLR